ncbi:hypothetical protein HYPSUDRAFT_208904 [Hypholoma sublateritium FD-334 SS-4]|uniref:Uncharacterized protein n=1 Tax=Hypholoma sublateritium (strain FD-334 SS-4) TaxID=945553 RepID=A0A0D2LTR7_HYPSF|nr:hypothetical protein HYPSUDRAFT_208904 [Hypholoma sublateritium FD-334 SS-4]
MAHNAAPLAGPSSALNWAVDANSPVGYNSRKALPIKRNDAEPLTREDVQFDLLDCIFRDAHAVFTGAGGARTTFAELYGAALYASSKCSKVNHSCWATAQGLGQLPNSKSQQPMLTPVSTG